MLGSVNAAFRTIRQELGVSESNAVHDAHIHACFSKYCRPCGSSKSDQRSGQFRATLPLDDKLGIRTVCKCIRPVHEPAHSPPDQKLSMNASIKLLSDEEFKGNTGRWNDHITTNSTAVVNCN